MGLDVYLEVSDNLDEDIRKDKEYDDRSEALWDEIVGCPWVQAPEEKKDEWRQERKKVAEEVFGDPTKSYVDFTKIELDHPAFPDHYFKIGYWRSSYNSGGINHLLRDALDMDLYYLLGDSEGEYYVRPEKTEGLSWELMLERAQELLAKWEDHVKNNRFSNFFVMDSRTATDEVFDYHDGEQKALEMFIEEVKDKIDKPDDGMGFRCYSSGRGTFMLDGIRVFGVITGVRPYILNPSKMEPVSYVIAKREEDSLEWYTNALKIVVDTINYVLEQKANGDEREFFLTWSG